MGNRLTGISDVQTQIEAAIRGVEKNRKKAVETVALLKNQINDLERSISDESCAKSSAEMERLNSATERLDRFIDSVVLENAQAAGEYERLECECRALAFESTRLEDLKTLCQEYEQLAKDLLCYSLGQFRLKESEVKRSA